ncbi:MAG: hypothetical protein ACYDAY_02085 [Candidatus Dormibacteria bacterium]
MVDWKRTASPERVIKLWGDELIPAVVELIALEKRETARGHVPLWKAHRGGSYHVNWDVTAQELTLRGRWWSIGITWFGSDGADLAAYIHAQAIAELGHDEVVRRLDWFLRNNLYRGAVEYQLLGPWTDPAEKVSWEHAIGDGLTGGRSEERTLDG